MDTISRVSKWFVLYFSGLITDQEKQELQEWLDGHLQDNLLFDRLCQDNSFREKYVRQSEWDVEEAIRQFDRRTRAEPVRLKSRRKFPYVAAAIALLLIGGISLLLRLGENTQSDTLSVIKIVPGSAKALLKLADGKLIDLVKDTVSTESLGNIRIDSRKGELTYLESRQHTTLYNELILPRGGEYSLKLADGTRIRLNSGSRLKYPVSFNSDRRQVELSGEAFFEVASDSLRPFCVKVEDITIKAYGTSFNINTHTAGHIRTVLVKGCVGVLVNQSEEEYKLKPSQLADYNHSTRQVRICDTDTEPYVAWTEGRFVFVNQTLEEMMVTLGLWYDFEVVFKNDKVRQLHFSGSLKRYDEIAKILQAISYTVGVSIRQEEKTLVIDK